MKIDRSPDRGSSSSVLFEFLLFDILRRPPSDDDDGSSFLGVTAVLRLISVLDDCEEPFFQHKKFQNKHWWMKSHSKHKWWDWKTVNRRAKRELTWNTAFACKWWQQIGWWRSVRYRSVRWIVRSILITITATAIPFYKWQNQFENIFTQKW